MFPEYLSTIGFERPRDEEDLSAICHTVIQKGASQQLPDSDYRLCRWHLDEEIQVWMVINPANEVLFLLPFFEGLSPRTIYVTDRSPGEEEDLINRITGWLRKGEDRSDPAEADESNSGKGRFQFSFLCPDAPLYGNEISTASEHAFRLLALSRNPTLFDSREQFREQQTGNLPGSAVPEQTFLSGRLLQFTGLLDGDGDRGGCMSYVTGIVRNNITEDNSHTGNRFYRVKLDTRDIMLDVFLDPDDLPCAPTSGNVLEGKFLIAGMYREHHGLA